MDHHDYCRRQIWGEMNKFAFHLGCIYWATIVDSSMMMMIVMIIIITAVILAGDIYFVITMFWVIH